MAGLGDTMSEADLQTGVIQLARMLGYRVAHFRPALTKHGWRTPVQADGAGFPDLLMVRGERLIVAELKSGRGRLSVEQELWLDDFRVAGVEAFVWRPADLDGVLRTLSLLTRPT